MTRSLQAGYAAEKGRARIGNTPRLLCVWFHALEPQRQSQCFLYSTCWGGSCDAPCNKRQARACRIESTSEGAKPLYAAADARVCRFTPPHPPFFSCLRIELTKRKNDQKHTTALTRLHVPLTIKKKKKKQWLK